MKLKLEKSTVEFKKINDIILLQSFLVPCNKMDVMYLKVSKAELILQIFCRRLN